MKSKTFKDLNVGDDIYLYRDLYVAKFKIIRIDEFEDLIVRFFYGSFSWDCITIPKSEMMNCRYDEVFSDINAIFKDLNNNL